MADLAISKILEKILDCKKKEKEVNFDLAPVL